MIVFDRLTKRYPLRGGGHVTIIEDFSGVVPRNLNIGILGRNGAGKSTMMRLIAGSEKPTSGAIYRDARISWPLGFAGGLNVALTGRQNMQFIADLYDANYQDIVDFVEDFAEIGRFMDQPMGTYSSGMRARLSFGVCMALDFDYYLIDEVIGVGDASFRQKCRDVLDERRQTTSVLLVSHSSRLLREFCDIGGVLHDGRLTFYDSLEEAIEMHDENLKVAAIDA
ncbi:MAG: ABC transporter ATP-binding protein [Pseudomonadota bacterium]